MKRKTHNHPKARTWLTRLLLTVLVIGGIDLAAAKERVVYYHNDPLGSPIAATDAGGNLLWQEDYAPYGERLRREDQGKDSVWYTGKEEDPDLGLYYYGARWYAPEIGRFLEIDPVGFDEGNPQSFNRYAYANNNPYKFVDPDGKAALWLNSARRDLALNDSIAAANMSNRAALAGVASAVIVGSIFVAGPEELAIGGMFGKTLLKSGIPKRPRARHHTDNDGASAIERSQSIKPSRGEPPGVDVEVEPFGSTRPGLGGPKADTGSAYEGAYVEFDLPENAIPTNVGPRNTARIPADGPLPIGRLNPRVVRRPWWKLW